MIDQLRRQIQQRLAELLGEATKLRRALAELSTDGSAPAPPAARRRRRPTPTGSAAQSSSRHAGRTGRPRTSRPQGDDLSGAPGASAQRTGRSASSAAEGRAGSGQTKTAVLAALSGGEAMTAGEVAAVTGRGRASVSTTLSKLAKSGEVTKAKRGYQRAAP